LQAIHEAPHPTAWQVRRTRLVVAWYLDNHFGRPGDPGTRPMFYDRQCVGDLAVRSGDLRNGQPDALFKVLVATSMFQRQRDAQVMRILRDLPPRTAREIGSLGRLAKLSAESPCQHLQSNVDLLSRCDMSKDPASKRAVCGERPDLDCHLKRHTEHLRRYGHFGKVPTSAALALQEAGFRDLRHLHRHVTREASSPSDAALRLEESLSRSWRISQKIACMFLSTVTNPDLGDDNAPWTKGVDWNHFVVVDSNVDLFLDGIGYAGGGSYSARRSFVQALARRVDLAAAGIGLQPYNARLVQQAMYLFMSVSNRKALTADCSHRQASACQSCPGPLRTICPVRQ
jgi:hypothetical protein